MEFAENENQKQTLDTRTRLLEKKIKISVNSLGRNGGAAGPAVERS
jgi:hypothetical protein